MLYTGILSPVFLAPFYYYQAKYIKAVQEFSKNEGNTQSAKKLKKTAYTPFIVLLLGFMMTTGYNRHAKRKENSKALEN